MQPVHISRRPRLVAGSLVAVTLAAANVLVFVPAAMAANLTVVSTADVATNFGACGNPAQTTSSGSLREAICAANNAGATSSTITMAPGTYHLANGELQMGEVPGSNITLNGAGAASTIITADGTSRVFDLDPTLGGGVTTAISGVTITGGADSTFGGAGIIGGSGNALIGDSLTISNSTVTNNVVNSATTNKYGGGLQFVGGSLTIINSTFSANSSGSSSGSAVAYAHQGVAPGEQLTISGTTFSGNTANASVANINVGGALHLAGVSTTSPMAVTNSRFIGNSVVGSGTGIPQGGGIFSEGGSLTVTESTFTGNSVTGGAQQFGGAMSVIGGTATAHYNRITGNVASAGSGVSLGVASGATLNATDNWWGCSTGPGTPGCDTAAGGPVVSPRLVLTASASPATVVGPNAASTITAALTQNSLGSAIGAANLDAFASLPVSWSDPLPSGATVATASTNLTSGSASTAYNSQGSSGPGHVLATLDNATATATVAVNRAPAITSANSANLTVGTAGSFTVSTNGYPVPALTRTGTVPPGMTFTDNGNGTATLAGTPTSGGTFPLSLTANNGVAPNASQTLTVTVSQAPAFTSAASASFTVGVPGSFTVTTAPSAYPTPSITRTGTLPSGLGFTDNGNGTATLSGTPAAGTGGAYSLNLTASNGVDPNATQTVTVVVNQGPAITTNPVDQAVNPGATVSFTSAGSGFPSPTVQWQRSTDGGASFTNIAGATSPTYTFTAATGDSGNAYRAVFANLTGSATSTAATLTVSSAPTISSANTASFTVGSAGSHTVTTSGFPNPALTTTGTLPAWLSFSDNGDGTGVLAGTPPAGSGGTYTFTITADNGSTPSDSQAFTLTVNESPVITSADHTTVLAGAANSFLVTTSPGFPVATALTKTGALPSGVTFTPDGSGGATIAGTAAAGTAGTYPVTITATNGASPAATQSFTLTVLESPVITSADHATFTAGEAGSFSVTTSGAPSTSVSHTGTLPAGLSFTPSGSGATISGTPAPGTGGSYPITITAGDGVTTDATQNFTLTVNQPPVITSADHAAFSLGVADAFTVTTSPGVPAAVTLTETGTLPAGVSFTDNGDGTADLAGTPSAAGIFTITIRASNGVLPDSAQSFTLTVNQAPDLTSADHATFAVGSAGSFTITTSPAADTLSSSGSLPAGISFTDNGDGTASLTGTPAAGSGGTYFVSLRADNATGFTTQSFTMTVQELPTFTSANHTTVVTGAANAFTVTTTAGFPVATALTSSGVLPSGMSFTDNGDGTAGIAGTAAAGAEGSYPLTITATNAAGTRQQSFTLTVVPPNSSPVITSADHATFVHGAASTFTVTTTAGYPTATTLTRTGALPAGVTFTDNGNGTATISGTPSAAGSFPITFSADNGATVAATQAFTLTVTKAPVFTSGDATTFAVGTSGGFTVTTTAGYPSATALTEAGSLPAGVTFTDNGDGTATVSGAPATGTNGTYPLTITASNTAGSTQQSFTLTVHPANASPAITSADHTTATKGTPATFTVTTSPGYPTATTIASAGTLPNGMTFTDNGDGTATLAGTPTAGGEFALTITASNGATDDATQQFVLTVTAPPVVTSADTTTFTSHVAGQSFTVTTTAGFPTARTITHTGLLPAGLTFTDNQDGTATISGTPTASTTGSYPLVITADNGTTPAASQAFTLEVVAVAPATLPPSQPTPDGALGGVAPQVRVGQVLTVTGSGYLPGAPIELGWYDASGRRSVLAHTFADGTGAFSVAVTVGGAIGPRTLMASGLGADGAARYLGDTTVVTAAPGSPTGPTPPDRGTPAAPARPVGDDDLAFTGVADLRAALGSGVLLLITGLALTVLAHRRRRQTEAS